MSVIPVAGGNIVFFGGWKWSEAVRQWEGVLVRGYTLSEIDMSLWAFSY